MATENKFTFEISLSVLNHLGRHLYRSFITVLGEAISNAWDAEAENVCISINKNNNSFFIKDDGTGMTKNDFQNKFLRIGYSKRKAGITKSPKKKRPYIGRKGIGKLALLSCADKITIISKTKNTEYVGGVIDNSGLDKAITKDLKPEEYILGKWKEETFAKHLKNHEQGTIIYFENIKGGIKNTLPLLKKIIALYFRFSLLDKSFNIFIEEEKITYEHLKDLAESTQFLWTINNFIDPYINYLDKNLKVLKKKKKLQLKGRIHGFIASVKHYRNLSIMNLDERVSIDLFVNGRVRERDILKHISKSRLVDNYLYGQIHFNGLDDKSLDRFTSNREGIVADDTKYQTFLRKLSEEVIKIVISDWDKWRVEQRETGDPDNTRITPKERKAGELFDVVSKEYLSPKGTENKEQIDKWVYSLSDDAKYNFESYADCFISENLVRKYIHEKRLPISEVSKKEIKEWRGKETTHKQQGNININIRRNNDDLSYLDMSYLVRQADTANAQNTLHNDAKQYRPIRNAVAHTALLTEEAKRKLTSVYDNIKGRIKKLLSGS